MTTYRYNNAMMYINDEIMNKKKKKECILIYSNASEDIKNQTTIRHKIIASCTYINNGVMNINNEMMCIQ